MSTPWGYGPRFFVIPPGETCAVMLDVPYRGTLQAISLCQLDGTADGTFEIFSSERAIAHLPTLIIPARTEEAAQENATTSSGSSSSSLSNPGDAIQNAYSITDGTVTITDGQYQANKLQIAYINRDGSPSNGIRRLWLTITHNSADSALYALSLVLVGPSFNSIS